jgi:diketogulonate reductase-like aldo/keto reductase
LNEIAKRHGVSVPAVCLAWALQRGTSVVAKSTNPQHLQDNLEAATSAEIRLSKGKMAKIASLDRGIDSFAHRTGGAKWGPSLIEKDPLCVVYIKKTI